MIVIMTEIYRTALHTIMVIPHALGSQNNFGIITTVQIKRKNQQSFEYRTLQSIILKISSIDIAHPMYKIMQQLLLLQRMNGSVADYEASMIINKLRVNSSCIHQRYYK